MKKIHPPTASDLARATVLPSHGRHLAGRAALLVCLFAGLLASQSFGTAISWNVAGDGNWSTAGNWTPLNVPVTTDAVTFNNTGVNANERIYLNGNQAATSLVFANTGTTTLLGGVSGTPANQTLSLSAGSGIYLQVNAGAGAVTIGDVSASPTAAVNLSFTNGSLPTFTNNSSNLLTVANAVYLTTNSAINRTLTINGPGNTTFLGNLSNYNGVLGAGKGGFNITNTSTSTVITFSGNNSGMTGDLTNRSLGYLVGKTNTAFGINNTLNLADSAAYNSLVLATDTSDVWANNIAGANAASSSFSIVSDRNTAGAGVTHTMGTITAANTAAKTSQMLVFQAGSNVTSGTAGLAFGAATLFSTGANSGGAVINALSATVSIASISAATPTVSGASTVVFGGFTAGNTVGTILDTTSGSFTTTIGLEKAGPGVWTLTGNNTNTGATKLSGGTLILDYTNNTSKLSDTGILTLNGGTLNLSGGSHAEAVASTTLSGGATSFIKRTSGTSTLAMGAITFTSGAVDFGGDNIATTTSTVTNGILSQRATVAGANFAMLSNATITNGIVAYDYVTSGSTGYTGAAMSANTNYALQTAGGANTLSVGTGAITNTLKIANTATGSLAVGTNILTLGALLFAGTSDYSITTSGAGRITPSFLHNFGTGNLTLGALGGTLTQYGTGKTILSAAAIGDSALTINGGTVQFSNNLQIGTNAAAQAITLNNGTLIADTTGGSIALNNAGAFSRPIAINLGGGTIDVIGGNSLTISGVISGTTSLAATYAAPVTFGSASSNGTFILTGANTYTGGTILAGGTTQVGVAEVAGTSGPLGKYNAGGGGAQFNLITFSGGTLQFSAANTYDYSSRFSQLANQSYKIDTNSQSATFASELKGASSTLTKLGAGTLTLSAASTYTGATTVSAGTLQLDGSTAAGSTVGIGTSGTLTGTGTVNGNATLTGGGIINKASGNIEGTLGVTGGNWNGNGSVTGVVTSSSGTFTIGSGANLTANGGLAVTGGTIAAGNSTSTITGSVNYTSSSNSSSFGGIIAGSSKTVTMNAAGSVLTLSGANTYTGATTVSLGTLLINGSSSAATGAISVSNGAILGGAGTVGAAITSAGTLSPGDGITAMGTFHATALTLNTGANFKFDLGASNASDQIVLTGAFTRGTGTSFSVNFNNTGVANSTYTLATFGSLAGGFTAGNVSNFTYTGLAGGVTSGTFGLTGTDLTFTTVPEPATWGLLAFSLTTVMVLRRRRRD